MRRRTIVRLSNNLISGVRLALIRALLANKCDMRQAIVVASTPRSGSTWLSQMLSTMPDSAVLFEPLHLRYVPEASQAGFSWRTYVDPGVDWPEGKAFLTRIFRGDVLNWWTTRQMTLRSAFSARFLIVKFVRASRLLPWMCRSFSIRAPVLLIRHPCAVIASQMRSPIDWKNPARPEIPSQFPGYSRLQKIIKALDTREEFLAADWALDYLPALLAPSLHPWQVISYEELRLRSEEAMQRIFATWGSEVPAEVWQKVAQPSTVTYSSGISSLEGWKQQLSTEQVRRILDVTNRIGIPFYADAAEPDYRLLHKIACDNPTATGTFAAESASAGSFFSARRAD